ncbi:CHASE domain-containing protein [Roseateles violae]|uniref:histidine kinase n=1 Tax=Roseateles violae TaxID=3058042 RepID=A0ABT8DRN0_9BURK|nr:CHASE domain-containing protein [Pelomonas sp. PFR6]MDN3920995.1 CHASE domain-containing protein [Pelomonas sp. PFR6]
MLPKRKLLWYLAQSLGLTLAYIAFGVLGLRLAVPPSYASPLYPAAGLALAALLSLGLRYFPAVLLGSLVVNMLLSIERGQPALLAPALIGVGAALQALFGAWAVRRWVSQPLLLTEPRDLAKFFALGAGLACLINPTIACLTLRATGALTAEQFLGNWLSWWLGDAMGVLIAAPMVLTLLGRPRKAWAPRRLSVGLPMLLTIVLMALGTLAVAEWDAQRARANFEREALNAGNAMEGLLREPLMALEASRGLLLVAPHLSRSDFERGTASYLAPDSALRAIGVARRVARQALPAFDAAARAEGLADFKARDRRRPGDVEPPAGEDMLAIRLIEPLARNAGALGVNIRSVPVARSALAQALQNGRPAATAGFQLSQDSEEATGVVVYQAFYEGQPRDADERARALAGVVFTTLRPDQLLARIALPAGLRLCLVDRDPLAQRPRLAGPTGCELATAQPGDTQRRRPVQFGGRDWDIRVYASSGLRMDQSRSWPFALVGLVCTGLLGVLLLVVTGRARRIEDQVRARTAELKREIAEREQAAQALRESELRFRNIFDNAPVGVIFTDVYGGIKEVNPQFCRLIGLPAETLQQMRTFDITHPDDQAEDTRLAMLLMRGRIGVYHRHKRYRTPDGRELQVRAVVSLLRGSDGRPHRLVGVVEDIADQLKMQQLAQAAEQAEAANRAKNEFLSRMSHELRTPLNAMLGFTQLLEMDAGERLSPRQRSRTAQIQQAGWHLLEMINDTLDLSRIESGALRLEPTRLNLAALLDEAAALIEGDARARRLTLTRALGGQARFAHGDATRVKQVLTNLLSNAVKYNVEGGSITVESHRPADAPNCVEISVSDTGLGLDAEQLGALFQPFNRLGREHSETAGTGIGLVISKRLAELMGGELRASSVAGRGSSFVLRLPAAEAAAAPQPVAAADSAPAFAGRRRVVYIEDNAMNAEVMRGILEQRPQIELEVHTSGLAGLQAVLAEPPDLLLLDMQLPDLDGLAVLKRLRAVLSEAALPVVVVSANALPDQVQACRAAGVQHYLTKPVDMRELLRLLDRLLEAQGA